MGTGREGPQKRLQRLTAGVTSTGSAAAAVGDLDTALEAVEADGFDATGIAAKRSLRGMLRRARDAQGQRLADLEVGTVEGVPVAYVGAGVFDATTVVVVGEFDMAVLGLRQDMTFKLLNQSVIGGRLGRARHAVAF